MLRTRGAERPLDKNNGKWKGERIGNGKDIQGFGRDKRLFLRSSVMRSAPPPVRRGASVTPVLVSMDLCLHLRKVRGEARERHGTGKRKNVQWVGSAAHEMHTAIRDDTAI